MRRRVTDLAADRRLTLDGALFAAGLALFLITRLAGLDRFPIFFLSDEALQSLDAAALREAGFRDEDGHLLPTYLRNGPFLNLSVSVYLQVLPQAVAGHSVVATRLVSVLVAFSAMVAAGLLLRDGLRLRFWWVVVFVFTVTPAWFLFTRTALETTLAASFYCWFLYCYLRFRVRSSPRSLAAAVVFAALTFYSYAPAKLVVAATVLLVAAFDAPYLLRNRRAAAWAVGVGAVLAVPEIRFQLQHPGASLDHLHTLGSYWVDTNIGLREKVDRFVHEYAAGLDPRYWFDPGQTRDIERHVMKGYGNLHWAGLPFAAVGIAVCVRRVRDARFRLLLLALVAAPVGGAIAETSITRALIFVVPATLITSIGLDAVLDRIAGRVEPRYVAVATAVVLGGAATAVLADALVRGPTWYGNYGLYGMQYGGPQLGSEIREVLRASPDTQVLVSPNWANGTDNVVRFFFPDEPRVRVDGLDAYLVEARDLAPNTVFVVMPEEFERASASPVLDRVEVARTVAYPDGRDGFYFVRVRYSPRAAEIIAAQAAERRKPTTDEVLIGGEPVRVTHPPFDIGLTEFMFDGDASTLARTVDVEETVIGLEFSRPRPLRRLRVMTTRMTLRVEATLSHRAAAPRVYLGEDTSRSSMPRVAFAFDGAPVEALTLRIVDPQNHLPIHVHILEIELG